MLLLAQAQVQSQQFLRQQLMQQKHQQFMMFVGGMNRFASLGWLFPMGAQGAQSAIPIPSQPPSQQVSQQLDRDKAAQGVLPAVISHPQPALGVTGTAGDGGNGAVTAGSREGRRVAQVIVAPEVLEPNKAHSQSTQVNPFDPSTRPKRVTANVNSKNMDQGFQEPLR